MGAAHARARTAASAFIAAVRTVLWPVHVGTETSRRGSGIEAHIIR